MTQHVFSDRTRLETRLALAEARLENHEEVLHEIGSTMGGVHAAARVLLDHGSRISDRQSASLRKMLSSELGRLDRLLAGCVDNLPEVIDVDEMLSALVAARRVSAHTVHWKRSGLHVIAVHDSVAESVNILLNNAVVHGKGSPTTITATVNDDRELEISVRDMGPGVPPELLDRIFERGIHGDNSEGSGLGLFLAHRHIEGQGGLIELRQSSGDCPEGAEFVITLPHLSAPPDPRARRPEASGPCGATQFEPSSPRTTRRPTDIRARSDSSSEQISASVELACATVPPEPSQ